MRLSLGFLNSKETELNSKLDSIQVSSLSFNILIGNLFSQFFSCSSIIYIVNRNFVNEVMRSIQIFPLKFTFARSLLGIKLTVKKIVRLYHFFFKSLN